LIDSNVALSTPDTDTADLLFLKARSHKSWQDKPVEEALIHELYELFKWGPTANNCAPARMLFVQTVVAKERLLPCLSPGNVPKVASAPLTVIVGMDMAFYDRLPVLFPHGDARAPYIGKPELVASAALRNSSLQGAYLILAARMLGLDAGPMSGFDANKVDAEFFAGTTIRANFICNLGYGAAAGLQPRGPRLAFSEACSIL
jgi:3-hydroxypropanoate dehydrogenase